MFKSSQYSTKLLYRPPSYRPPSFRSPGASPLTSRPHTPRAESPFSASTGSPSSGSPGARSPSSSRSPSPPCSQQEAASKVDDFNEEKVDGVQQNAAATLSVSLE